MLKCLPLECPRRHNDRRLLHGFFWHFDVSQALVSDAYTQKSVTPSTVTFRSKCTSGTWSSMDCLSGIRWCQMVVNESSCINKLSSESLVWYYLSGLKVRKAPNCAKRLLSILHQNDKTIDKTRFLHPANDPTFCAFWLTRPLKRYKSDSGTHY